MVQPDGAGRLAASLERPTVLGIPKDIEEHPVRFRLDDEPIAYGGSTRKAAETNTDEEGRAVLNGVKIPPSAQRVRADATVDGKTVVGEGRVFRFRPGRVIVVVDIDDTISRTDFDDVIFDETDEDSRPLADAPRVLRTIADDFHVVYLTARPVFLLDKTRGWLRRNEFPDGPVLVSHRKRDLIRQGAYKRRALKRLRETWPAMLVGIGDRKGDAEAYGANGMLTLILNPGEDDDFGGHALRMANWRAIEALFKVNRGLLMSPEHLRDVIAGRQPLRYSVEPYTND